MKQPSSHPSPIRARRWRLGKNLEGHGAIRVELWVFPGWLAALERAGQLDRPRSPEAVRSAMQRLLRSLMVCGADADDATGRSPPGLE